MLIIALFKGIVDWTSSQGAYIGGAGHETRCAPIAHYVIICAAIYGLVYNVPGFSVLSDTCADSVYQDVLSLPHRNG